VPHQRLDAHDVRALQQLHGDEEVVPSSPIRPVSSLASDDRARVRIV
jgi:hypothetical protein